MKAEGDGSPRPQLPQHRGRHAQVHVSKQRVRPDCCAGFWANCPGSPMSATNVQPGSVLTRYFSPRQGETETPEHQCGRGGSTSNSTAVGAPRRLAPKSIRLGKDSRSLLVFKRRRRMTLTLPLAKLRGNGLGGRNLLQLCPASEPMGVPKILIPLRFHTSPRSLRSVDVFLPCSTSWFCTSTMSHERVPQFTPC